jgi:outer membrane lipoprotein-sorting protein
MMSRLKTFMGWSLMSLAFLTPAKAQTVDDIINKNIDAMGGREVLSKISSAMFQGTTHIMGNDSPLAVIIVNGKGYKSTASFNGTDSITCVTDTGSWILSPMMGQTSPQVIPADQRKAMKALLYIGGPLVDYKDKGYSAELAGREDVPGQSNYKIRLFDNEGTDVVYYINPQTYLVSKTVAKANLMGEDVNITSDFSDYRKTDIGYTMAYTVATSSTGPDQTITYTAVEFNKDVDPKTFEMPGSN